MHFHCAVLVRALAWILTRRVTDQFVCLATNNPYHFGKDGSRRRHSLYGFAVQPLSHRDYSNHQYVLLWVFLVTPVQKSAISSSQSAPRSGTHGIPKQSARDCYINKRKLLTSSSYHVTCYLFLFIFVTSWRKIPRTRDRLSWREQMELPPRHYSGPCWTHEWRSLFSTSHETLLDCYSVIQLLVHVC